MLKEPEIKLFGRNIYLPDTSVTIGGGEWSNESSNGSGDYDRCFEDRRGEEVGGGEILEQRDEDAETEEQDENTNTPSESKTPPTNDDDETKTETETETEPNSQKKSLKKPDKILPCPRCKSMDTKFCYYNNYNVNQPRHFCKSCQRYWTAGGTMRNVPVGAGRRKNKSSASHCRHITISEAFQAAIVDAPNGYHHNLKFKPNATVLSFGPDPPLSESMADKILPNDSSLAVPNPPLDGGKNGYLQPAMPVPCIPGVPWPYSAVPVPAFFHPVPYYTAPVWNSGGWNLPWLSVPSNTNKNISSSTTTNSLLGKHSRSGDDQTSPLLDPNTPQGKEAPKRKSSETTIVVPKTLRIDDPEEAAKSSIWSTLGIKYDAVNREGLLKAFQPKIDHKKTAAAAASSSPLLQANPAALSRSLAFQETA